MLLGTQPAEVAGLQLRVGPSGVWAVWSQIVTLPNSGLVRRPYVTHLLADGTPAAGFTLAGAPVASGLEGEAVVTDSGLGASGDLMTLIEYTQQWPAPSASGTDLLAQRVLTGGGQPTGWPANGRVVCDAPGVQEEGHMFRQGDGAFFAWKDQRADDGDIYALRVLADGTLPTEWSVNGLLVCGVAGMQYLPVIGYNTVGGGFVAWLDQRDHATHLNDLYGQTVSGDARLSTEPDVPVSFALSAARPNPARGPVRVRLDLPVDASVAVEVLDVAGRLVHRESFEAVAGSREFSWDLRTTGGVHARPGLYLMRVRAAGFQRSTRVVVTE